MRIQVINYLGGRSEEREGITYSPMSAPNALDDYDINIIDLSVPSMWRNKGDAVGEIDSHQDLDTLRQMVSNKRKAVVVYALPQNSVYYYSTRYGQIGTVQKAMKDVLDGVYRHSIEKVIPLNTTMVKLAYERTGTIIQGRKYEADFYLINPRKILTKSDKSEKPTTIEINVGVYATTLAITKQVEDLHHYITSLFDKKERTSRPDWMEDVVFGDDEAQNKIIQLCEAEIAVAKGKIQAAKEKLRDNEEYKSILYTNGDELVSIVFKILEQILNYDLSTFKDKKKEDFLIKFPGQTFIGEIKGVTSNIKYEHISQVELHYRGYLDQLSEDGLDENVKQLLIMNPFRTKALEQREPIHVDQIKLAQRNECLIIETNTLLRVYERFCKGQISVQKCIAVLAEKTGLLRLSDIEDEEEDLTPYKV